MVFQPIGHRHDSAMLSQTISGNPDGANDILIFLAPSR